MQMGHYFVAPYNPGLVDSKRLKTLEFLPSGEFEVRIFEHAENHSARDFNVFRTSLNFYLL